MEGRIGSFSASVRVLRRQLKKGCQLCCISLQIFSSRTAPAHHCKTQYYTSLCIFFIGKCWRNFLNLLHTNQVVLVVVVTIIIISVYVLSVLFRVDRWTAGDAESGTEVYAGWNHSKSSIPRPNWRGVRFMCTIGWHDRSWTILNSKLTMLELLNIY